MVTSEQQGNTIVITLLPNRSATWRQTKYFLLFFACVSLTIAFYWVAQGAWVVLPFAGIEIALLSLMMYRVSWLTYRRQIITVSPDSIRMEMGVHYPSHSWQIQRFGAVLHVEKPETRFGPVRLMVKQSGHSAEVGHFLNQQDKQQTEQVFKEAGIQVHRHVDWPQESYV